MRNETTNNASSPETAVTRTLVDIYAASRCLAIDAFDEYCCRAVGRIVDIDAAILMIGSNRERFTPHRCYPFNLPDWNMNILQQCQHDEETRLAGNEIHGHAASMFRSANDAQIEQTFYNYCANQQIIDSLSIICPERHTQLLSHFLLFRKAPHSPFSESDRQSLEIIAPHISQARYNNLCFQMHAINNDKACAITDRQGFIHTADRTFSERMTEEWPGWHGQMLPREVITDLDSDTECAYLGQVIAIKRRLVADLYVLNIVSIKRMFNLRLISSLTGRQSTIAGYLSRGYTYKEIATTLGISPSTVTNHVNMIYRKLKIQRRSELARFMAMEQADK